MAAVLHPIPWPWRLQQIAPELLLLFAILVQMPASRALPIQCRRPSPQPLSYCHRYSSGTCCSPADDQRILQDVAGLYAWGAAGDVPEYAPSPSCVLWTSRLACAACDPALTGPDPIYSGAICLDTCRDWFRACRHDLFAWRRLPQDRLVPCSPVSLICSTAADIVGDDHVAFCTRSGFPVAADRRCYRPADPTQPEPSSDRWSSSTSSPSVTIRSWSMAGVALALILIAIRLRPHQPTDDDADVLARRARLVQAWAERNQIDLSPAAADDDDGPDPEPTTILDGEATISATAAHHPDDATPDDRR